MTTDKIYSMLSFTGIPIGGTQTLAHQCQVGGVGPLLPDVIYLQYPSTFELVSCDTINLTIRNTGNPGGACLAEVHVIHPVERSFGLAPDDGTFQQGMVPRPYCPGSPNAGGGVGGFYVVVFRPGGVATENVVTTWADAVAMLSRLQGRRILQFDDSLVSPIVLPTGAFDMTDVRWTGGAGASPSPDVRVPEGGVFTGLRWFDNSIRVTFTGTAPPVSDFDTAGPVVDAATLDHGATITSSGAGPFFRVTTAGGVGAAIALGDDAALVTGQHAVVDLVANALMSVTLNGAGSAVQSSTLSSSAGSVLSLVVASSGIAGASEIQAAVLGTLTPVNDTKVRRYPTEIFIADTVLTETSQLVLLDPDDTSITLTLPLALNHRGETINIKNVDISVNTVVIAAAGGNLIDGVASIIVSGARFFLQVTSDGGTNWYVTG